MNFAAVSARVGVGLAIVAVAVPPTVWCSSGATHSRDLGEAIYQRQCAACHDHPGPRIPPRSALQQLSVGRILRALDFGVMMRVAYPLQRSEREAVARFLGVPRADSGPAPASFCANREVVWDRNISASWTGWSTSAVNTRFQPAAYAGLSVEQVRNLKLKWAFGFDGDITAFAAPTLQNGVLFVGSASGVIYAMNAKDGCLHWTFQADGPVRAAILIATNGAKRSLLFGDQIGWFYSLDAQTGSLLWKRRIDKHEATRLTGSAVTQDGIVFVPAASWEETRSGNPKYPCCTFRGSVTALRVTDGSVVWKYYTVGVPKQRGANQSGTPQFGPSGAGIWSTPTIDVKRGVLYVTTGDNYSQPATSTSDAVLALTLKDGKLVWSQQMTPGDVFSGGACADESLPCGPDFDFGSSALLTSGQGHDVLVAGQKSGMVYAFDPDAKGKVLWQARVGKGGDTGGVQWGIAADEDKVYAAVSDSVSLPADPGEGQGPMGGKNFDPIQGGGLTALRISDGSKTWFAPSYPCAPPRPGCSPAQPQAITAIPGAIFSGSLDGHIRAFATENGALLWDFDTEKEYHTVNGVKAKGGSLDGAGPVIGNGMVYVNSGYPRFGGAVGNVLLAFSANSSSNE
jgi:polyvinyl alcohol dehydrogenase (cytochrome)